MSAATQGAAIARLPVRRPPGDRALNLRGGADGRPLLVFPYLVTAIICAVEGKAGRLPDAPLSDAAANSDNLD